MKAAGLEENWTNRLMGLISRWRGEDVGVDHLDVGLRGLGLGIVLVLSLFGYQAAPDTTLLPFAVSPLLVAGVLLVYNLIVLLLVGVPWRQRPGFWLFALDWIVATVAIFLTGGFFSPFLILYYSLLIGAALRIGIGRSLLLAGACSLVYLWLSISSSTPADSGALHLPWLVVGITSLLMVATTAIIMKRLVDVENARSRLQRETAERVSLLNDLTGAVLSATPDEPALLRSVSALAPDALGASGAIAVLFDKNGHFQHAARSDGTEPEMVPGVLTLALWVAEHRSPVVLPDVARDPHGHDLTTMMGPLQSAICCPLLVDDEPVGTLIVGSREARVFSSSDVSLLSAIGRQISVSVRLSRLYDRERFKAARSAELEQMERELLSTVSHELRTPLTAIKTSVSGLLGAKADQSSAETRLLQNIDRSTERLIQLVNEVLDMARLRAQRVKLDKQQLDVAEVIRDAVGVLRPLVDAKGQELMVDLPLEAAEPPLEAAVDRRRLEQIMTNILNNAHKYTPAGGKISTGARREGCQIKVWVTDSGPGITLEDQARIFDRFFVGGDRPDATGLGLGIARSLVELHGGHIGVRSKPGAGSTFYFTLPIGD